MSLNFAKVLQMFQEMLYLTYLSPNLITTGMVFYFRRT